MNTPGGTVVRVAAALAIVSFASAGAASAQAPAAAPAADQAATAPAPRFPDGHVNLGSAPGTKGYWEVRPGLGGFPRAADVPFKPWAKAVSDYRNSRPDLYPPLVQCKAAGGPSFFNAPGFEIVEVPELKSVYILNVAGPHSWRVVYMDSRPRWARICGRPISALHRQVGRRHARHRQRVGFNESSGCRDRFRTPRSCT